MVALCRWVPVEPSHGAGGMGTGCHPAWPQHQESSSVTCCYGRRKGRFNLFLSHKIRRDVTSPALMTGRGGLCNTSSPHCSREPSGVKGPGEAMSSGCNGASLASGPLRHLTLSWHQGGTGHHIILVDPKGPWDPSKREWAPEGRSKGAGAAGARASGCSSEGPESVLQPLVRLSPRKAPRSTDWTAHHARFVICFESLTEPASPVRAVSPLEKSFCSVFFLSYTSSPEGVEIFPEAVVPDKASGGRLGPALEQQEAAR